MDYYLKLIKYRGAGVREYWIVDPDKKTVLLYHFMDGEYVKPYLFSDDIPVGIYPGYSINLKKLIKY